MTWLAEDSLPIWMGGAVLLTAAILLFLQSRRTWTLLVIFGVVLLTTSLLLIEKLIVTPREAVARTLYDLADAVESNDVTATLRHVSAQADEVRTDVETLLPRLNIAKANVTGTPVFEVDLTTSPPVASATFRGFIDVTDKLTGMKGAYFDELRLFFVQEGDQWLLRSYTAESDWGSLRRGNRQ